VNPTPSGGRAPEGPQRGFRPTFAVVAFTVLSLLAVLPVLVLGLLESQEREQQLVEAFDEQAAQQAATVSDLLTQVLASKAEVLAVTAGTLRALDEWNPERLQAIGDAQLTTTRSFDSFYIADADAVSIIFAPSIRPDGTPTRAGVDYSDRSYYQELIRTKEITYSHVQVGKQSKIPNIVVAVPIVDVDSPRTSPRLRGYAAAGIHVPIITKLVRDVMHIGDGLRILIVDARQNVLVDSMSGLKLLERVPSDTVWDQPCTAPTSGIEGRDDLGRDVRLACAPMALGEHTWTVFAASPRTVIVKDVATAQASTIRFAALALVLAIAVSALLAVAIGQQMRRFYDIADRIAAGERNPPVEEIPWFSPKEVEVLSEVVRGTLRELARADDDVRALVEDLRETNQRMEPLATAWEQITDAVEVLDSDGIVRFVNPAWRALMGSETDDPVGTRSRLFASDDLKAADTSGSALQEHVSTGQGWSGEVRTRTGRGIRVQGVVVTPVLGSSGEVRVVIVSRRDLTELRRAESTAVQNDRLAAVGTLAAGLAHEINNPLTYVQTNLHLIREGVSGEADPLNPDDVVLLATDAMSGVERVTRIVRDLLSLARSTPDAETRPMTPFRMTEVVRAAVSLAGPQTNSVTQVVQEVPPHLQAVGRESELVQVLLNLVINAGQAMAHRPRAENRITIIGCSDDEHAWLEVADNGPGIPDDVIGRIFEPLFTTKPVGQGTGLGLSVSRSIIEAHGGQLMVTSEPGEGTRFTIRLPIHRAEARPRQSESAAAPVVRPRTGPSTARVLLVDDDPLVARSLGRVLRPLGVVVVNSGQEGLDALAAGDFQVVVSDVRMPGMNGLEFHEKARTLSSAPFIFVTGGTSPEDLAALDLLGCPVLGKPVNTRQLLDLVSASLASDEEPPTDIGA